MRRVQTFRLLAAAVAAAGAILASALPASAATVTQIGSDQYTNTSSQHATQVEPDSFSFGSTIVAAAQTGRFLDGGSSNINVSVSTDGGTTWTDQGLPGLTNKNPVAPGPYDRVSDPAVAYDARHGVWLISSLPIDDSPGGVTVRGVATSRSTDGGATWSDAALIPDSVLGSVDKNWIVCDNSASSPFYGSCYTEWDDNGNGNKIYMSTSSDGGVTWGPRRATANNATGLGGQPLVQRNGTVVVPIANANETALLSFRSTDGGATWSATTTVTTFSTHTVAGGLRTGPLPSAEVNRSGKIFVAWQDCRFRTGCARNDIVFTTSTDGVRWTAVRRVPIDPTSSTVDHFIPGLAVDASSGGTTTRLALAYYYYPSSSCSVTTCQLNVGYVSSANGGSTWTAPQTLAGPMTLSWLPNTTQGRMVGDYISTSFVAGTPIPVFPSASAPTAGVFNQPLVAALGLTAVTPGTVAAQTDTGGGIQRDVASTPAVMRR